MISFYSETDFRLKQQSKVSDWIVSTIADAGYSEGDLSFIFCSDEYLLEKNIKYLNHNVLTDIITFDYTMGKLISGDIFISIERVTENAGDYEVSFKDELHRVIIHGILHLLGYKDKTQEEKQLMREKEDYYLSLRTF